MWSDGGRTVEARLSDVFVQGSDSGVDAAGDPRDLRGEGPAGWDVPSDPPDL